MLHPGLRLTAVALLALALVPVAHAAQPSSPEAPAPAVVATQAPGSALFTPAPIESSEDPFGGCDGTFESLTTLDSSETACQDYCASNGWEYHSVLFVGRGYWACLCCNTGG